MLLLALAPPYQQPEKNRGQVSSGARHPPQLHQPRGPFPHKEGLLSQRPVWTTHLVLSPERILPIPPEQGVCLQYSPAPRQKPPPLEMKKHPL